MCQSYEAQIRPSSYTRTTTWDGRLDISLHNCPLTIWKMPLSNSVPLAGSIWLSEEMTWSLFIEHKIFWPSSQAGDQICHILIFGSFLIPSLHSFMQKHKKCPILAAYKFLVNSQRHKVHASVCTCGGQPKFTPVSYTHLTLPTTPYV